MIAPMTILELERVRLRRMDEGDVPALFAMYSNPETALYLSRPALTDKAQAEEMIAKALAGYADGRDRKSTRLNSSHIQKSRMPSSA